MAIVSFKKLYIPEKSIELMGEYRRLVRISSVLRRIGIITEYMIYWNGEGIDMYLGAHPPNGYQAEGLTYVF